LRPKTSRASSPGQGKIANQFGVDPSTVQRISRPAAIPGAR
jgi:hypothetical protein